MEMYTTTGQSLTSTLKPLAPEKKQKQGMKPYCAKSTFLESIGPTTLKMRKKTP